MASMRLVLLSLVLLPIFAWAEERTPLHFHTEPIPLLVGEINAGLDVPIGNDTWSVGPAFWYINFPGWLIGLEATGLGVRVNKHFGGKAWESSWYLGAAPYLVRVQANLLGVTAGAYTYSAEISGGYQWAWERFAMRLGVGYGPDIPILDFTTGIFF